jgi:radical SAM superfamily enzyme YgiQ (UPF0313 family)
MKIKLIAPHEQRKGFLLSGDTFKLQRLCLPILASLTPSCHTVKIVDESFAPDNFDDDVDLVGVTVMTELSSRAYEIADRCRLRGVKVVMGGIHPTVLPDEALQHADSVVVGEAEDIWPQLLNDASIGKMHKIYTPDKAVDLQSKPIPCRDLYPNPPRGEYTPFAYSLEASRGCPYDCEFCTIGTVTGKKYRSRPVSEVIAEIESINFPYLFFVDDAIALNRTHAKMLFSEMIPLKKLWVGQGTATLAEDPALLKIMRQAGCKGLLVGFESMQSEAQEGMRKISSMKIDYAEAMRRFHDEGIAVLGAFVFGFDHEDKNIFAQTLEFSLKTKMDGLQLRVLTPFPGTRLYTRLLSEGRLIVPNWWSRGYSSRNLLFHPKGMDIDSFLEGFANLQRHAYSYPAIFRRFWGMSPWKRTALGSRLYAGFNLANRHRYLKNLVDPQLFEE